MLAIFKYIDIEGTTLISSLYNYVIEGENIYVVDLQ